MHDKVIARDSNLDIIYGICTKNKLFQLTYVDYKDTFAPMRDQNIKNFFKMTPNFYNYIDQNRKRLVQQHIYHALLIID